MKHLYAPFSYWLKTRFPGSLGKLSFVAIFLLPQAYVCLCENTRAIPAFLGGLIALGCVYELGYFQNDFFTTRKEAAPTFRLRAHEHEYIARKLPALAVARCGVLALALACAWFSPGNFYAFCAALGGIAACFFAHNTLRSRANVVTYSLLCALKYCALPILTLPPQHFTRMAALAIAFVLPRCLEHATKPKYGFAHLRTLVGDHDTFRAKYYLLLTLAALPLYFLTNFKSLLPLSVWFLLFRLGSLMLRRRAR